MRFLKRRYSTWCFGWVGRVRSWLSSWRTAWPSLTPLRLRPLGWWDHVPVAYQPWDAACPAMRRFSTESLEKCEGEGDSTGMMDEGWWLWWCSIPYFCFFPPQEEKKKHHAGRRISTSSGNITKKMPLCHSWPFLWYASFTHTQQVNATVASSCNGNKIPKMSTFCDVCQWYNCWWKKILHHLRCIKPCK